MIPITLQLKNFLSYGPDPQEIDFSNYHLICLSGKNGHGKSALLDAITWAIWGQARKTAGNSKADQGLLHLGQKHMFVIIEFEVNGQRYRIRREYVQTKSKPFASLDFGIMQEDKKIAPLTDKTIRSTQEKIEKTIGITYDSFVNSTFLRQGQSNEFSKKSAKERKEVLAEILQLQQFEDKKKIALLQAKKFQQEYKTQYSIQQRIEQELTELTEIPALYKQTNESLQQLQKTKLNKQKDLQTLEHSINKVTTQIKEQANLLIQQTQLENNLDTTKKTIQTIAQQWHKSHQLDLQKVNIKELIAKQKELQLQLQTSQEALQKRLVFKEEYLQVKEQLANETKSTDQEHEKKLHSLQVELTKLQEQHSYHEQQKKMLEQSRTNFNKEIEQLYKQISHNEATLKSYEKMIKTYQIHESEFDKMKQQYQQLCAQGNALQQQIVALEHNIQHATKKQCLLCEQSLSTDQQTTVQSNLQQELEKVQKSLSTTQQEAAPLKDSLAIKQKQLYELKKQHEESINLISKHEEQQKQLNKLVKQEQELAEQLTQIETQITKIQTTIQQHKEALQKLELSKQLSTKNPLQQKLKNIETEAKKLAFDPVKHKELEAKVMQLNQTIQDQQTASDQITKQAERKAELFSLFKQAQEMTNQLSMIKKSLQEHGNLQDQEQLLHKNKQEITSELQSIESECTKLLIEKGSLEQKQKKQLELIKESKKLTKELTVLHQEMSDYQEIAKALGKDGIQALLIEQAVPEIEHQANEILARLTNNQTQIFIESLRDLKKGGNKETLDIKISDSFGIRDYELFSGGEAFRIDFALRIGISKLLARKAGTTLQTIFIDEGFGSQDEEGLQLIMDNIYKIQEDFAKIIIVSHLPEMKEHFPVQFIVDKKRSGSTISIIEQG